MALTGYTANGASYTLDYDGTDSVPIVRGQNNTTTGIAAAIAGGNEQQQAALTSFNGASQSYQIQWNGQTTGVLGFGGTAISSTNVAAAITALSNWPVGATVVVSGAGNTGFTVTFGGTLANQAVPLISIVNCTGSCTSSVRENSRGTTGILGITGATATIGTVADTGYSVTFTAQGNIDQLTVTNPSARRRRVGDHDDQRHRRAAAGVRHGNRLRVRRPARSTTPGSRSRSAARSPGRRPGARPHEPHERRSGYVSETNPGGPAPTTRATAVATGDSAPVMTVPAGPFTIPYQTPFALTGSATDADNDPVTYMWEQFDRGGTTGTALTNRQQDQRPAVQGVRNRAERGSVRRAQYGYADCSNGENCVNTNPTRVFPDMAQILANNTNAETGDCPGAPAPVNPPVPQALVDCYSECLPTPAYPGPMHFILTGRDGHRRSCVELPVQLNLAPGTGPFLVTAPNTAVTWRGERRRT